VSANERDEEKIVKRVVKKNKEADCGSGEERKR
jgi:hypothetical protein